MTRNIHTAMLNPNHYRAKSMPVDSVDVAKLLNDQLDRISDPLVLGSIRTLLVQPRCEEREWNYGDPGQTFPCWIVFEHIQSNTGIAYCEHDFGPDHPWGLLFLSGKYSSMGMACAWYDSFEEAYLESRAVSH